MSVYIGTQVVNTRINGAPRLRAFSMDRLCQSDSELRHDPAPGLATCNHPPRPMDPTPIVPIVASITFAMMIRNWNTERPFRRRTTFIDPLGMFRQVQQERLN